MASKNANSTFKLFSRLALAAILFLSGAMMVSCEDVSEVVEDAGDKIEGESHHDTAAPQPVFVWCYGGVNGSKSVEDPDVQISGLKIKGKSGMSYKWSRGSLANWGLANNEAGALACAFYLGSDGRWYGGKFDWISTSRTSRNFTNINEHYHGWDPDKFYGASKRGFLILSDGGRRRTNFITE